jgi:hypothetical protein
MQKEKKESAAENLEIYFPSELAVVKKTDTATRVVVKLPMALMIEMKMIFAEEETKEIEMVVATKDMIEAIKETMMLSVT